MRKGGFVLLALIAALFVISGCGDSSEGAGGDAHINEESGMTHNLLPDDREGTPPKPAKETDLEELAERADCYLFLGLDENGRSEVREAFTEPRTYGDHTEPSKQLADGAYREMPTEDDVLGALNNGRMAIQYAPDLAEEAQLELKGLYDTMYGAALLFPNDDMAYAVAATTWTNYLSCGQWQRQQTIDVIRAFGKETWGKYGHRPVDAFPFEGPTPAEPEEPSQAD